MTFPIDQSPEAEGAPEQESEAPAAGTVDLDKFKEELMSAMNQSFDERFKGFQKTLSKRDQKIAELEQAVQQANRADLTEDERAALEVQEKDAQIARLQMALELKELETEFPDVAPHFGRILSAESPREQMEILRSALNPTPAETRDETPTEQPEPQNASVDPNNPADTSTDGMDYDTMFEKDPSLLERILKSAPRLRNPNEG